MESRVLYEASFTIKPIWLIIPALLAALIIYTLRQRELARKQGRRAGLILGILGTLLLLWLLVAYIPDRIRMYQDTIGAYQRGEYQIAEGYVEDFHPWTPLGHGLESFTLDKVPFQYGMTDCFGYQTVKFNGGVITGNGQHLRIAYTNYSYLGNVIVCIEELP